MSTPPASVLAPPGAAPAVAPAPTPDRRGGAARALGRWCDPEWLPFAAVLLTPALVWALLGDARRAGFFLGAAAWVATLKWLGWLLFGRFSPRRPAFALFPAEVFVGLAVVGVWFYLRNLLGLLWPASYSLRELAALPVLAAGLHLLHGLFHLKTLRALGWRGLRGEALRRLAAYGPYVFLLAVALAKVSSLLGVQGSDAVFYVTATRVFLHDGLFRQVHGSYAITYPSGHGAVNAAASALAPLSPVQAVELNNVLLMVTAVFLVIAVVVVLSGRLLPGMYALPMGFLATFPMYALYPDINLEGAPRLIGPPLMAAVVLLPLLAPAGGVGAYLTAGAAAVLAVLAAALNPACVPFAAAAAVVALAVLGWRGGWRVLGAAALTLALAGGLVLGSDHYYRGRLTHSPTASHFGDRPVDDGPFFRPAEGARAALARNPLALSPQGTVAVPAQPLAHLLGWQEMLPQRLATWAALALGAMAILAAAVARRRGPLPQGVGPLAGLVAACFLLGLALKYLSTFAAEGLSPTIPDAVLLRLYLYSQALRLELLLLLPLAGAGAAALYLLADQGRPARRTLAAAVAATAAVLCCTWLLISPLLPLVVAPAMIFHGHVNPDDLELVAWIDAHLPADGGLIAPACETYVGGLNEKVIVAFDGGMALPMYSRRYDLAFSYWGDRNKSHDDYLAHVKDRLDADWCRANGIRYFYVTPAALHLTRQDGPLNPGLARAIAEGRLRVVHQCGESVLYEVAEGR